MRNTFTTILSFFTGIITRRDSSTESNEAASTLLPQFYSQNHLQQSVNEDRVHLNSLRGQQRTRRGALQSKLDSHSSEGELLAKSQYGRQQPVAKTSNSGHKQRQASRADDPPKRPPAPLPTSMQAQSGDHHGR